jgi:hypothetical protein
MFASGAVVEYWTADSKDVGLPPACEFIKSWRVKHKFTHFINRYICVTPGA